MCQQELQKHQTCKASFTSTAPKATSLQLRPVHISTTPYYMHQKSWLGKLFILASLNSQFR